MKLLLDTHTILWLLADDPNLSSKYREAITMADETYWSIVSLWEIGIKEGLERSNLRLVKGWENWIPQELHRNGFRRLDIEPNHCSELSLLPSHHKDPFDRMLIAQAKINSLTLLTRDPVIHRYGVPWIW